MTYTFLDILSFTFYGVVILAGLLLIVVLARLYEVLGLWRDVLQRTMFARESINDTLAQIRLFCQKYTQDPEE